MLECLVKVVEGKMLINVAQEVSGKKTLIRMYGHSVKTFISHVDTYPRTSTMEDVLNDQIDGIASKWTTASLCHWSPKWWHIGYRNRIAMVPGMGTMHGPSAGSDSSRLI